MIIRSTFCAVGGERVQEDLAEWVKEGRKKRRVKGGGRSREGEDTNV
jgi:hypothetical protein